MIRSAYNAVHAAAIWLVLLPVMIYRRVLSPLKRAPSCRFQPTCSEYAITAVRSRGIVVGTALAVARLLRCNPLFRGGYDPVPCAHDHDHVVTASRDPGAVSAVSISITQAKH